MDERLQIIATENNQNPKQILNKNGRRQEIQATMERLWHQNPRQFDPQRDCMQKARLARTTEAMRTHLNLQGKRAADLGCGGGELSRQLRDAGCIVDAVDVASNALQHLKRNDMTHITAIQDCLPTTRLHDSDYDLVVCTEVIGYLQSNEYRLLFSELARLVKPDGHVVCSSELDIDTEDPLQNFASLAETEFAIDHWLISHHMLLIRLCRWFGVPNRYIKANRDSQQLNELLEGRSTFGRLWVQWNTSNLMTSFWRLINLGTARIVSFLEQSRGVMNLLEKICRFLWNDSGISHATFIGKRRPLVFPLPADKLPKELKHKRQVWE